MDATIDAGNQRSLSWLFADGAASISASMLAAVLINALPALSGIWAIGLLHGLTRKEDGVIVVATLLLLPSTFVVYGVSQMIFAAKEAVERRAMEKGMERGREQGVQEGGQAERERIEQILKEYGVHIPPEAARRIDRKDP